MKTVYLLDTNIVSEPIKPAPSPLVLERLRRHDGAMAIASLVWHELLFGVERLPVGVRRKRLWAYLIEVVAPNLPVTPYDDHAAWIHASFRASLETKGAVPSFADGIIAATALANNLILVTRDVAAFKAIPNLHVENWFEQ